VKRTFAAALCLFLAASEMAQAQFRGEGWGGDENTRTAREVGNHSTETPDWKNPTGFEKDVFTFARVRYSRGRGGSFRRRGSGWSTDMPDSDLNLSYRLQQMTSIRTDPDGRVLNLTDPDLVNYPWIYMVEPGGLYLSEAEALALRKYLLNGGFMMCDDFWGESEWRNLEMEMKKVFPERSFKELPLDHPLYNSVFPIKSKGQVPNYAVGEMSQYTGVTWETNHDGDTRTVHHRVITDDQGRLMVFAAHNTDNGDGWEREGEYQYFFENFSEKISYPLGINIVFYVMTH
jgi:hypothetical protein